MAYVSIFASELAAALFLLTRATTPTDLRAERGKLRLSTGATELTLTCLDGSGALQRLSDSVPDLVDRMGRLQAMAGAIDAAAKVSQAQPRSRGGSISVCAGNSATPIGQVSPLGP